MRTIYGRVRNQKIQIQRFFRKEYEKWGDTEIEITKVEDTKTSQQLRYLWGIVYKLVSEHTGFTPEEVSEVYKKKFLSYEKEYKGKIFTLTKGISSLTKREMSEFMEKVIQHAQEELQIIIPEPDIAYVEYD